MSWIEVGQWFITESETLLPINFINRLVIKADSITGYRSTWNWAGYCYQYLDFPDIGLARINQKINVAIQDPILFVPTTFQPSYRLKFLKADWIPSLTLIIYEDSMPLNFEPSIAIPSNIASTTVSATIPVSTTSVSFLAPNANRKKMVIANNSNQDLYIDFDPTASVADHCVKIPKITASGFIATYEMENFTGSVSGIWAAAGTGAALVREMV